MTTGERIKAYRLKRGMTQGELAKAVGSTTAAISRYELNQREARYSLLKTIANVLDAPEEELLEAYPKEPLKISEYKERLTAIENDLRTVAAGKEPVSQIETLQCIYRTFAQLLDEERFALKITEETRYQGTELIEARKNSMHGRLLTAFDKLNEDGQEKAVEHIKELGFVPYYQKYTLPKSLQRYINDEYHKKYEPVSDTEEVEEYESSVLSLGDEYKTCRAKIRYITLKNEAGTSNWYCRYYQFEEDADAGIIKQIIDENRDILNDQNRYFIILDDISVWDNFCDILNVIETEAYEWSAVNGDLCSTELYPLILLMDKDTWEIKKKYSIEEELDYNISDE